MLYSVSNAPQPQDAKRAQSAHALPGALSKSLIWVTAPIRGSPRNASQRRSVIGCSALLCSALLCSALLCSEQHISIPHGCQAPFRQKYEKFPSHVSACQRGFFTPAHEHKDTPIL